MKITNNRAPRQRSSVPTFQCRVCGVLTPIQRACRACGSPPGLIANPNDPMGATFLPMGMLYPPGAAPVETTPFRALPPSLARLRWNWGAFGASLAWLIGHGIAGWALLVLLLDVLSLFAFFGPLWLLIPYSGALLSLILGRQGHTLAWQRRSDNDESAFLHTETRWTWLGIIGLVFKTALLALLTLAAFSRH